MRQISIKPYYMRERAFIEALRICNMYMYLINDDKLITKQLDQHAPIKTRRVKSKHMPEWFSSEIAQARKNRDIHKKQKNWAEFRKYRNLTKTLIR